MSTCINTPIFPRNTTCINIHKNIPNPTPFSLDNQSSHLPNPNASHLPNKGRYISHQIPKTSSLHYPLLPNPLKTLTPQHSFPKSTIPKLYQKPISPITKLNPYLYPKYLTQNPHTINQYQYLKPISNNNPKTISDYHLTKYPLK